ncbi:putative F-box protein At5g55150 [Chenopodium quinoa]|uniref:putative F-box protein At5g55150 n=1 Tax=Chenopodium quinoa TaxID=63459 RepID=UPI000B76E43D|nr:putative F-box protein At5g55150 [Chenopodium quinoa]
MAWSEICGDCLGNIADKLTTIPDYQSLRLVCQDWASTLPKLPRHRVAIPPLLMLLEQQLQESASSQDKKCCHFISIIPDDSKYSVNLPEVFPPHRIVGSSHGCLIIVGLTGEIFCLNPISKDRIDLPRLSDFSDVELFDNPEVYYRISNQYGYPQNLSLTQMRDWYVKKIILSSYPADGADYIALAIIQSGSQLAYCKRGDTRWNFVPLNFIPDAHRSTEDAVYYNGILSALSHGLYGDELTICDLHSPEPTTKVIDAQIPRAKPDNRLRDYLVSSEDDDGLLLVSRYTNKDVENVVVYKFDTSSSSWVSQETLHGKLLFLGLNSSLSFQASDFRSYEENTIYFSDDVSMETEYIDPLIWFTPNPWWNNICQI